jgi:serine/threonine protein kinase
MTADEARELVLHLASGLANLHDPSNPQVHRDLKPENVLRVDNSWKIADFGLIRELGTRSAQQTTHGTGTAAYAPPEFYHRHSMVSTAWDIWSLGVILVEALTGRNPFEPATVDLGGALQAEEPAIPTGLVSPFDQIARGCLVEDRTARWTAPQVLTVLRGGQVRSVGIPPGPTPDPIPRSTWLVWLAAAVVVAIAGFFFYHQYQSKSTPVGVTGPMSGNPVSPAPKSSTLPPLAPPSVTPAHRESGPPSKQPPAGSMLRTAPKAAPWTPSLAFTSSAEEIEKGTSTTLVWAVEGSSDVRLDGEVVPARGSRTVSPNETTVYHLVAYGPESATSDRQVRVSVRLPRVVSPAPTIVAFEIVPNPVDQCAIAILRWTVKNATGVSIEPGIGTVDLSGYRAWRPLQSAQFALRAEGPGGTVSRDVTVSVNHATRTTCGQ